MEAGDGIRPSGPGSTTGWRCACPTAEPGPSTWSWGPTGCTRAPGGWSCRTRRSRATGQLIRRPPQVTRYSMLDGGPELGKVGVVPGVADGARRLAALTRPRCGTAAAGAAARGPPRAAAPLRRDGARRHRVAARRGRRALAAVAPRPAAVVPRPDGAHRGRRPHDHPARRRTASAWPSRTRSCSPRCWRTTCRARGAASAPGGSTVADGWSRPRCSGGSGSDARRQACPCRDGSWVRPGPSSLDPSDGGEPDQHPDLHRCPCGVVRPGPWSSCQPMDVRIPPRVRPAGSISRRAGP